MILSEHKRRWVEVRFYYFCFDIFQIRKNMLDVVLSIEAISQIGTVKNDVLKRISGKMLGDPYYLPHETELILLANLMEYPLKDIATYVKKTKQAVSYVIKTKKEDFAPTPRLAIDEDQEIDKFMKLVDIFKKAGI